MSMTIGVDVDGVCADLTAAWLDRYNRDYDDCLTAEEITGWDMEKFVLPECGAAIYNYLEDPSLYHDVLPIENALLGVNCIRKMGHRVVFITSCNKVSMGAKLEWLRLNGFFDTDLPASSAYKNYIAASDKSLIKTDALIDDGPHNFDGYEGYPILFSAHHNYSATGFRRASNWNHVTGIIAHLEGKL